MYQLAQVTAVFFKIGLFSIGGGYAIIPLIQEQVVNHYGWITQQTFTDIITISQMTPGPLAVNTSTFIGLRLGGIAGAVLATCGCVISGICIAVALYSFFKRHRESLFVFEVLNGLKASSLGLIMSAAVTIILLAVTVPPIGDEKTSVDRIALIVFAVAFFILRKWKVNPILIMLATGFVGFLVYR